MLLIFIFEFSLGAAREYSWGRMLSDYDIGEGGLMVFGLLFMLFSPALAANARGFDQDPVHSRIEACLS